MRFNEFKLTESVLAGSTDTSWSGYLQKLLTSKDIGIGPQGEKHQGLELNAKSKNMVKTMIKDLDTSEDLKRYVKGIEQTVVTFTNGVKAPLKSIFKSAELKGSSADTDGGKEIKPWNEGEVAETILGASLYARFISKKDITAENVYSAMDMFTKNVIPGGFELIGKRGTSTIKMTAMNKPMNNKIVDDMINDRSTLEKQFPAGIKALDKKIAACAAFVNESLKVIEALEKADTSPGAPIVIKTDGVGNQKGTKADLEISVGQYEQLLSLKVNEVKQFGQDSGQTGTVLQTFFQRFIPDLDISEFFVDWNGTIGPTAGWPDMRGRAQTNALKNSGQFEIAVKQVYLLTGLIYQKAGELLSKKIADSPAQVIEELYSGITHHAHGGKQGTTVVILNPDAKTAWKELEFGDSLVSAIGNYRLESKVTIAGQGKDNHMLQVFGRPITSVAMVASATDVSTQEKAEKIKTLLAQGKKVREKQDPEMLFQLRSYNQGKGNQRNIVEMGLLLKDLTDVQKLQDASVDDTQPTVVPTAQKTAPLAAAAKPAQKAAPQLTTTVAPAVTPKPQVTNIQPSGNMVPADQEPEEVEMESQGDRDLDRIRHLSGMLSQLSKHS